MHRALSLFPEMAEVERQHERGVLPSQMLRQFVAQEYITAAQPVQDVQIQPSSIDLRLGAKAYRVRASFLPRGRTVQDRLPDWVGEEYDIAAGPQVLERGGVYVIELEEKVSLPGWVSGKANPKSTTGRLDVFTRLLRDYGDDFDLLPAGYKGSLYAEVVPRTFNIAVRAGDRLNQLRLVRGDPQFTDSRLKKLDKVHTFVYSPDEDPLPGDFRQGLRLSVDLRGRDECAVVGYRARRDAPVIDLRKIAHYQPEEFWQVIERGAGYLVLEPEEFYILASKERVSIPPDMAAVLVPFDASIGEFRIHYAGFFDPGFGWVEGGSRGSHAVLEVRSHEVPFVLEHEQVVGRLEFEWLLTTPDKIYGGDIGSSYQSQGLALSKQFRR
jgi:dCTP deaminase